MDGTVDGSDIRLTSSYTLPERSWCRGATSMQVQTTQGSGFSDFFLNKKYLVVWVMITLPQTNSKFTPENGWLEYFLVSFWQEAYFQGIAVRFREL